VPVDIRPTEGELPTDLAAEKFGQEPTIDETWPEEESGDICCSYTPWTICYRPLYFEDIALERYGCNVGCLQTGLSRPLLHVGGGGLYKMTVRPPRSCQCSNGFSRCGDCRCRVTAVESCNSSGDDRGRRDCRRGMPIL
jgi:hypothetical protein